MAMFCSIAKLGAVAHKILSETLNWLTTGNVLTDLL